ncbi:MAG: prolipoprotein diacylglyceryl transferase [Oceanospirillaceae bacterium]|nr:prolipoprotein diacylglyceryl transferase [Oceanospirillaceae bacterium]
MVWLHEIDPIALGLGPLQIHWYGLMYLLAFGSAWMLGGYRARKMGSGWSEKQLSDLIFYCAIGVILGGRMGYVLFYHFDYFLQDPLWLFAIWEGGMSFHGGLLGVVAVILWFSRREGKTLLQLGDFVAPLVPLGLAAGRIGNFIGGELWGRATDQSWGVIFPRAGDQLARHPSQLYQALVEGVLLFALVWIYSNKPRKPGSVAGLFLVGYGIARSSVEFFREPDAHLGLIGFDLLSMGQLLSLPMVVVGLILLLRPEAKR